HDPAVNGQAVPFQARTSAPGCDRDEVGIGEAQDTADLLGAFRPDHGFGQMRFVKGLVAGMLVEIGSFERDALRIEHGRQLGDVLVRQARIGWHCTTPYAVNSSAAATSSAIVTGLT